MSVIGITKLGYFKGRNFRVPKKNAKFLTKTFAFGEFWNKFRGKNFDKSKKSSFSREKAFASKQQKDIREMFCVAKRKKETQVTVIE